MSATGDPRHTDQPAGSLSDELPAELVDPQAQPAPGAEAEPQTPPGAAEPAPDRSRGQDAPPHKAGGLSGGAWVSLIAGTVVLVLLLVFIVQNNTTTGFQYFGWHFDLPLGVAMLLAAIAGVLVAGIVGSVRIFILQRRLKRIERALDR